MKSYFNKSASGKGFENLKSLKKEFEDIKYESGAEDFDPFFITTIREIGLQNAFDGYKDAKDKDPNHPDFFLKISLIEDFDLIKFNYFKEVLDKIQPTIDHLTQKTTKGEADDGELQTLQHLRKWAESLNEATILKIEDNGTGLIGRGNSEDSNNASTRSIAGSSTTNKSSGKGGSFGKGAKTAIFLSNINTVFYHSHSPGLGNDLADKSLGHTILPTFLSEVDKGDPIGEDTFCVSDNHNEVLSTTPTWIEGGPYEPFQRTIEGTGLTVSAVSIKKIADWESQVIFAIATSHVFKLISKSFENWKIQIGDIILNDNNFIESLEEIYSKDFLSLKHSKNCSLQVHYLMSIAALKKELEEIDLVPVDFELKDGTNAKGTAKLLLGKSPAIGNINKELKKDKIENQFLFVNNGMTIRSSKTEGRVRTTFLKIDNWYNQYFGFILLDDNLCEIFRQAEEPSHDKINSAKLNEKENIQLPNQRNLNIIITGIEDQVLTILNNKEDVEGDETDMASGGLGDDADPNAEDSPWKKIVFKPVKKAKEYKTKTKSTSAAETSPNEKGYGESRQGNQGKGGNTAGYRRAQTGGSQSGFIKFDTTRIITASNDLEFALTLFANLDEEVTFKKIILRQEVTEEGKSSAIDKEYQIQSITVNNISGKVKAVEERIGNKVIKSNSCKLNKRVKTNQIQVNLKVKSNLVACPKLTIILPR
jgi:hypothetical protein